MIGLVVLIPNFLKIKIDIRLILAPRSHTAQPRYISSLEHETVKLPKSFIFSKAPFWRYRISLALATISYSFNHRFLESMSFRNLRNNDICFNASTSRMFMCNCLTTSRKCLNYFSSSFLFRWLGKGGGDKGLVAVTYLDSSFLLVSRSSFSTSLFSDSTSKN